MEIKAGDLAHFLKGELEGRDDVVITGFSTIEDASSGDLSFIANPKYSPYAKTTKADVLLVGSDFNSEVNEGVTVIRVSDPYAAIAQLLRKVEEMKPRPSGIESPVFIADGVRLPDKCYIGAFSYIAADAEIAENVLIYPQVYIGRNVKIGSNTILYPGVKVYNGCMIGKNCIIHSGVVIGSDGFGFAPSDGIYEKIPQNGIVEIEDNVEIGANTTIDRATFEKTIIGKGTKLDNLIQIAHNVTLGENNVVAAQAGVAGSTHIGDGNRIGGQCGFAGHIRIGDNNEFGAQSGIPHNVGNNNRLIGYPAVDIHQFAKNIVYMKRLDELFKNNRKTK